MDTELEPTAAEIAVDDELDQDANGEDYMDEFAEPTSMDELFGTVGSLERQGVWLDYGAAGRIKVACAGGSNVAFLRVMANKVMPYKRLIQVQSKKPSDKLIALSRRLQIEAYVETVVLNWEGIKLGGEVLPYSKENCFKLFKALPRLFDDLMERATDLTNFQEEMENDVKNS